MLTVFLSLSHPYFLRRGFSLNLESAIWARRAGRASLLLKFSCGSIVVVLSDE